MQRGDTFLTLSFLFPLIHVSVNNVEFESKAEEKKDVDDLTKNGPKPILPYSSMFILSPTNP